MKKIEVIDLFCGIGGFSYGLKTAGLIIKAGLDSDPSCKKPYETNTGGTFIKANIATYDFTQLEQYYSKDSIRVLIGSPPCQWFSKIKYKKNKKQDEQSNLTIHFVRAIKILTPNIIIVENVPEFVKSTVFAYLRRHLLKMNYQLHYKIYYCPNYGVPQTRKRLILRTALPPYIRVLKPIKKTHSPEQYVTVRDAIGHLPPIEAGETCKDDPLHTTSKLTPINLKRIRQSKPGGTWRDWNRNILPNSCKKENGQSYQSVYGRMFNNQPSPTITTQFCNYGSGRFGHPEQDRALSIREAALLQTFNDKYNFVQDQSMDTRCRQIGNAVPPRMGEIIGKIIVENT